MSVRLSPSRERSRGATKVPEMALQCLEILPLMSTRAARTVEGDEWKGGGMIKGLEGGVMSVGEGCRRGCRSRGSSLKYIAEREGHLITESQKTDRICRLHPDAYNMVCVACLLPLFLIPIINLLPRILDLLLKKVYGLMGKEYKPPVRIPPSCPIKSTTSRTDQVNMSSNRSVTSIDSYSVDSHKNE
ncbi:hypothetical protein L7F22_032950 [Adiantum nelumboides]|nr:hypothetical protein [Adiantum nelumboides]